MKRFRMEENRVFEFSKENDAFVFIGHIWPDTEGNEIEKFASFIRHHDDIKDKEEIELDGKKYICNWYEYYCNFYKNKEEIKCLIITLL